MSDSGDSVKYKWTPESTSLLVSVWSDKQVQKQLEYAAKPQLIWESVARYMKKKGYNVCGKQCRSRMKQVLVCYREAKRAGTRAGLEQYYELIDKVLKNKRIEENNIMGIDTVDAIINVKSPPKEMKTNKNLQMRHKFQDPVPSLLRTDALSPTWMLGRENEYPDSPESNNTIIAQPYRVFSPTRDAAINTGEQLVQTVGKSTQCNSVPIEEPLHINYKQNVPPTYTYTEVPFQNTVQNVQNQIIQENMQQHQNLHQNLMCNQHNALVNNLNLQQNLQTLNQGLATQYMHVPMQANLATMQNPNLEHIIQQQNQLQQVMHANNRAVPQEPKKVMLDQNLAAMYKQQYGNILSHMPGLAEMKQSGPLSPNCSPDVSQNLNDAFCQSKSDNKSHNLNETYNRRSEDLNPLTGPDPEISVVTNNATYNDDSLLEFFINSPTPSENYNKSKDSAVNTDNIPHVPLRKKKAQKLEQLVLNAINSQNEVVNKILAAQNDMVTRFLDIDRDRQNRLENRMDDLLKVVHASMVTKQSSESDVELPPPPPEPTITSLVPPPKPGAAPPKLDLVPPKPCRVPCTVASSNTELVNQNTVTTRPGVVSPITSPIKKPGTIWSKLGPVSQSPFVKAQQRLGFQSVVSAESRTQSSAERRIAREVEKAMDIETLIFETKKFLEIEKEVEAKVENARLQMNLSQTLHARRRLFTQREPTAAMILTAAFLENECRIAEQLKRFDNLNANEKGLRDLDDDLLAGQGESYERLRQLNVQSTYVPGEPCDASTPAKLGTIAGNNNRAPMSVPKQTIQQLAQLVMNSGRWKEIGVQNAQQNLGCATQGNVRKVTSENTRPVSYNGPGNTREQCNIPLKERQPRNGQNHIREWMSNNYENPTSEEKAMYGPSSNAANQKSSFPMGFTTAMLDAEDLKKKEYNSEISRPSAFNNNVVPDRKQSVRFMDEALAELQRMYIETVSKEQQMNDSLPYVMGNAKTLPIQSQQMIEKYIQEMIPRGHLRGHKDKDTDSDNDDEFLDTTATLPAIVPRRSSIASSGTASTETAHSLKFVKPDNCILN